MKWTFETLIHYNQQTVGYQQKQNDNESKNDTAQTPMNPPNIKWNQMISKI
jgi:hypothetical protein